MARFFLLNIDVGEGKFQLKAKIGALVSLSLPRGGTLESEELHEHIMNLENSPRINQKDEREQSGVRDRGGGKEKSKNNKNRIKLNWILFELEKILESLRRLSLKLRTFFVDLRSSLSAVCIVELCIMYIGRGGKKIRSEEEEEFTIHWSLFFLNTQRASLSTSLHYTLLFCCLT